MAAGGGAAAGSVAGPLGTLGGAVVSWFLHCWKIMSLWANFRLGWGWTSQLMLELSWWSGRSLSKTLKGENWSKCLFAIFLYLQCGWCNQERLLPTTWARTAQGNQVWRIKWNINRLFAKCFLLRVWIEDAVQLLPRLGSSGRALPTHEEGTSKPLDLWRRYPKPLDWSLVV